MTMLNDIFFYAKIRRTVVLNFEENDLHIPILIFHINYYYQIARTLNA